MIYLSSSSVTDGSLFLLPTSFETPLFMPIKIAVIGVMMNMNAESGAAIRIENRSEFSFARLLGKISPKISTSTVMTTVARPTLPFPNFSVKSTVASEDEEMFTTLFPTSIAVSALSKLSHMFIAFFADLFPSSASFLSLILLHEENAVSVAEQIADSIRSTAMITTFIK